MFRLGSKFVKGVKTADRREATIWKRRSFQSFFQWNKRNMSYEGKYGKEEQDKDKLIEDVFGVVMKFVKSSGDRRCRVVKFKTPDEMKYLVDFDLGKEPQNEDSIKELCEKALEYSVKTSHARFYNQQYGGLDKCGLAAEFVVAAANTNLHTFEVAPFFVMAEKAVLARTLKLFGYRGGEGTFCPGGSYSSMLAAHLARYQKHPESRDKGIFGGPRMVMFASEQAHYSAQKNAHLLGIGLDNCIKISCNKYGKMVVSELEREILKAKNEGGLPFFVVATAGTTVLGAFDPFHDIADVCEKHGVWLHIDACWGGSAIFSKRHRHLCSGMERSDSIMWNAHKMLMMPIQCSLLLTKHEGLFSKVNSFEVPYLFQPKKPYDVEYDVGRNLIQCSRRVDSFKLWIAWKANGDEGFERHVDALMDTAGYLRELVKKRDHFRLVIPEPEFTNISFWFIPPSLRGQEEDAKFWDKLHLVAPAIKTRMQSEGSLLVGYQPLRKTVNFFRMVLVNGRANRDDMEFVLDEIERCGSDL